jgi:hypothetical protein
MNRRILLTVTAIFAAVAIMTSGPAVSAAEVSAKSTVHVSDATGDVPYCKGDIVSADASWSDARLVFQLDTACRFRPTDAEWTAGASGVGFLLDINGDDTAEYLANYDSVDNGVLYNPSLQVVCNGSASHNGATRFEISFSADCLPGGQFRYVAAMSYDEDPYGATCTCPEDHAPNATYSDRVYKNAPPAQPPIQGKGYWMLGRDGAVYAFGDAPHMGNGAARVPAAPWVDIEPTPSGRGYWLLDRDGRVQTFGDAVQMGGFEGLRAGETATAVSATPSGNGYWVFTSFGRVMTRGAAEKFGDMDGVKLNGPVLDAIPTTTGQGYYMVGSDGGIFTFGDAVFRGSMGDFKLNAPVQSLVPDSDGVGYWLVASDGGIFSFEAEFYGSMGSTKLNKPITGMVGFGNGYLMVGEDGGIFTFGDAPFYGSLGDHPPAVPIVSTAILNQ